MTTNSFTLNLEAVALLLGAVVSITILLGLLVSFTNKINQLEIKLQYFQQELLEHSNLEGHRVISERLLNITSTIHSVEKAMELHIQDYINRKDLVQYMLGQMDQKIEHKFLRLYTSMKDMEKFLQKSNDFRIREYFDSEKE